jgi:tetratricopeptide (TPR) repeat protein
MLRSGWIAVLVVGCVSSTVAIAVAAPLGDRIKTFSEGNVLGTVETITRNEIILSTPTGNKTVSTNDIAEIHLAGEPHDMGVARADAAKGDYEHALQDLDAVKPDDIDRELVRQEREYLKLLYAAKFAISGQTPSDEDGTAKHDPAESAAQAGKQLNAFLKAHPNSAHFYEGNEVLGDLLVSLGNYDAAANFYKELESAPWPDFHARAALLRGRALQMQGKYADALQAYDAVLKAGGKGPLAEQENLEATIGRTYSLAGQGKAPEAIKVLKDILANADDDDVETLARAYNALGNCYVKTNDTKQALWAYLRVDLEYSRVAESHAEALANLSLLWTEMRRPDRAREARDTLQERYPFSRWTKKVAAKG